jgi:hypothetical protein
MSATTVSTKPLSVAVIVDVDVLILHSAKESTLSALDDPAGVKSVILSLPHKGSAKDLNVKFSDKRFRARCPQDASRIRAVAGSASYAGGTLLRQMQTESYFSTAANLGTTSRLFRAIHPVRARTLTHPAGVPTGVVNFSSAAR